jgi:hypothetical protein
MYSPQLILLALSARLKSCPFKTEAHAEFFRSMYSPQLILLALSARLKKKMASSGLIRLKFSG